MQGKTGTGQSEHEDDVLGAWPPNARSKQPLPSNRLRRVARGKNLVQSNRGSSLLERFCGKNVANNGLSHRKVALVADNNSKASTANIHLAQIKYKLYSFQSILCLPPRLGGDNRVLPQRSCAPSS